MQSVVNESEKLKDGKLLQENTDFTQEQFDVVWKKFAKAESSSRPRLSALLNNQIPQKPENGTPFRFIVDSQTVKDYLYKNLHNALEGYLRANLHNSDIELRFELEGEQYDDTKSESKQKGNLPYTSKEKYMYMLDKNPALKLLRDHFDLETD